MFGIYLILQAVGLGIVAQSFKLEGKGAYTLAFGMGSGLSLLVGFIMAPSLIKLLIVILIMFFSSKLNLTVEDVQAAILNFFRISYQILTRVLSSRSFEPVARLMPTSLTRFFLNHRPHQQHRSRAASFNHPSDEVIIDIESVPVTRL